MYLTTVIRTSVFRYPRLLPSHPHLASADFIRLLPVAISAHPQIRLLPIAQDQGQKSLLQG